MASFLDYLKPIGMGNPIIGKKYRNFGTEFLTGTPEKRENVSTLRPEQEDLYQQLVNAGLGHGAGGAFGGAADYYRGLLGDNSADFNAFAAPQLRQYNQEIVPGLSEQFAGMGAGGLSSSGFRNAQVQGATDLAERLGAIRANLRQAGAQGLQNIGQQGLQSYSQNMVTEPGTEGFLSQISPAIGSSVSSLAGHFGGNWLKGLGNVGANTNPYGSVGTIGAAKASPSIKPSQGFQLPGFLQGTRFG